jgi:hypothetical protein
VRQCVEPIFEGGWSAAVSVRCALAPRTRSPACCRQDRTRQLAAPSAEDVRRLWWLEGAWSSRNDLWILGAAPGYSPLRPWLDRRAHICTTGVQDEGGQIAAIAVSASAIGSSHCAVLVWPDDSSPHAATERYGRMSTRLPVGSRRAELSSVATLPWSSC